MAENEKIEQNKKVEGVNLYDEASVSIPLPDEAEKAALSDGKTLALTIAEILDKKKAQDIKIINVNRKTVIADYFVIAGGSARTAYSELSARKPQKEKNGK